MTKQMTKQDREILRDYIASARSNLFSDKKIKKRLLKQGWNQDSISNAFKEINKKQEKEKTKTKAETEKPAGKKEKKLDYKKPDYKQKN